MIVERHYDDETLIALLDKTSEGASQDPHLSVCGQCLETLESYRAVSQVLGDDAVWSLRQLTTGPDPKTMANLRSFTAAAATETESGAQLVDLLISQPRSTWSETVRHDLRYQTAAVVRQLVERSEIVIDTMPPDALEMARIGVEIGQLLGHDEYTSDVVRKALGAAWRQYGYTLFYIGEFNKALDASERARSLFEQCAVADYDLARVGIVRALVYGSLERYEEAQSIAVESARIFRAWGDRKRLASALSSEAHILILQDRYFEALPILEEVENDFKELMDSNARARVIGNIALCFAQTGRIADALQNYQIAAAIHEEMGTRTEAARIRYNVADLLATQGKFAEAQSRMRRIHDEFASLGMTYAAVCAGLGLAETLLVHGDAAEAEVLCRTAIEQFQRTGLAHTTQGLVALTFLREATVHRRATPEVVRHVRKFIERLPREPGLAFAAPALAAH